MNSLGFSDTDDKVSEKLEIVKVVFFFNISLFIEYCCISFNAEHFVYKNLQTFRRAILTPLIYLDTRFLWRLITVLLLLSLLLSSNIVLQKWGIL